LGGDGPTLAFITVRSLIHLLLPDGGAQSIASIDVHVAGVLLPKNWQGASRESRGRSLG
jgi:hypothetical protein